MSSTGIGSPVSPCSISDLDDGRAGGPLRASGGRGEAWRGAARDRQPVTRTSSGRPTTASVSRPTRRTSAPEVLSTKPSRRHHHHERGGVVHERAELRLVVVGDLEGPPVGEVTDRQHERAVGGAERRTDELHQPPAVLAEEPDLDREADAPCPACSATTERRCPGRRGAPRSRPDIPTDDSRGTTEELLCRRVAPQEAPAWRRRPPPGLGGA